ncbi:MAG: TolC family protein [Gammaproteobacteria bacterium]|nr:TolC family protein [Gammaproteobacteria bacterium]
MQRISVVKQQRAKRVVVGIVMGFFYSLPVLSTPPVETWSLSSATAQRLVNAAELRAGDADVAIRQAELNREGAWPNPTLELRADQRLGLEDGSGGVDLTQIAITQTLPWSRLERQRTQARANLSAAHCARIYLSLQLENQVARIFHQLQLTQAKYQLALRRLETAQHYDQNGSRKDKILRYLAPIDRARLDILRESAQQSMLMTEGEWREAGEGFRRFLLLSEKVDPVTVPIAPAEWQPVLSELIAGLDQHPALREKQLALDSARAGIAVAAASRWNDPALTVFRERDYFGARPRDNYGISVAFQIPLWNQNRAEVDRASAKVLLSEIELTVKRRELEQQLRESYLRYKRLQNQSTHYASKILEPSQRFLGLTQRGFSSGELGVLALLDANNNYFDSAQRHLELLSETAIAAANLRLAAGISVVTEVRP